MSDRIQTLNRSLRRSGFQLSHASSDPVLGEMDAIRSRLRLQSADSLKWCEETSRLASLAHLRSLFALHDFDLVLDVVANRGQFASTVRSVGFEGTIVSFEPNPTVLPELDGNARHDDRWVVVPGGVGASEETLTLHDTSDSSFASLLPPNETSEERFGGFVETERRHEVRIRRLGSWLSELDLLDRKRVFLKSDTQGFDLEVLRGCGELLESVRAVLVELSFHSLYEGAPTHERVESFLAEAGFLPSGSYPISYYPDDLRLIESDGYFVRAASS